MSRLYTVDEIADRWSCTPGFVRKILRGGTMTTLKIGDLVRVREADLLSWEEARARQAPPAEEVED
jgi:excisionase family DNA binding protein